MSLTDAGPVIILSFLLITYLISAYEKINDWKGSLTFYRKMYEGTFLAIGITPAIILISGLEIVVSTLAGLSIWDIVMNQDYELAVYAFISSSVLFAILLFGLRIAKDYPGSARIAVYFLVSVLGLFWTQSGIPIEY
ncbi:hypothetical protein [Nonlabens marinus]|uniref:Uncharacterized protein n=1 Tax=Nonlabens marinus S1-08 TaxID=1454201 RepID=W8VP56_9FLAO|nr:hypothetical protein [Nonlabens marinus]BAO54844.1 hypothetical protein NMS_0835 [Nonlabens marinus S1-08]